MAVDDTGGITNRRQYRQTRTMANSLLKEEPLKEEQLLEGIHFCGLWNVCDQTHQSEFFDSWANFKKRGRRKQFRLSKFR